MANERKTEEIARQHFQKFGDEVTVEEQSSDSPQINKLLQAASKDGRGRGYPDFLISLKEKFDLLIVVECKADPQKHQSPQRDQYKDFAVDGALHYASHLSKGFDVLAIGISGTNEREVKVSHFLQLRNQRVASEIFGDVLLSPTDYIAGYSQDPIKYQQDYEALQNFIRDLNVRLHSNKVAESNRSLLISAILLALEQQFFKNAYASEGDPTRLAKMIVNAAQAQLEDASVGGLSILAQQFGFLPTATGLTAKTNELKEIVQHIDTEVTSFIKNHKYRDVLGNLYVEFLKYANSDKSLGIVLTPPHITELFADLAQVNTQSIVYDNCAGTGGFLISAMKRMIENAHGSMETEKRIKQSQLFGVEFQAHIYALAVSNMYIHQDGKSNIYCGDCFDEDIIREMRKKTPTVGLLNPPYKAENNDREELDFVLNNLECLTHGATCVAIVPMSCALATRGPKALLKEKLMQNHTLEAVCSMPNELFFNSKVSVVSCIMIFTAHRPHPPNKEVFLGYFKDDGFEKKKVGGRTDASRQWPEKKQAWLDLYINRKAKPGMSVNVGLTHKDEWAAEAYMETDYTLVSDDLFEDALHEYATYLFRNRARRSVSDKSCGDPIALNTERWKWFSLTELFDITGSKTTPIRDLELAGEGEYPYVTTQATNNGVDGFYSIATEDGGVLTLDSAVLGYCAYQKDPFSASDHVEKLIPKFEMNAYIALFLVAILNIEQYRYNYGRKCSQTRLKASKIKLPVAERGTPDYAYMEKYIKGQPFSANLE